MVVFSARARRVLMFAQQLSTQAEVKTLDRGPPPLESLESFGCRTDVWQRVFTYYGADCILCDSQDDPLRLSPGPREINTGMAKFHERAFKMLECTNQFVVKRAYCSEMCPPSCLCVAASLNRSGPSEKPQCIIFRLFSGRSTLYGLGPLS